MVAQRALSDEVGDKVQELRCERSDDDLGQLCVEIRDTDKPDSDQNHSDWDVEFPLGAKVSNHQDVGIACAYRVLGVDEPLLDLLVHLS